MWFKHLVTVVEMRKKGSKKAAETRQKNKKAAAEIRKGTNEAESFVVHVSLHTDSTLL